MTRDGTLSSAIGWAIRQGQVLRDRTKFKETVASLRRARNKNLAFCLKDAVPEASLVPTEAEDKQLCPYGSKCNRYLTITA
jgi:hypothetical protein